MNNIRSHRFITSYNYMKFREYFELSFVEGFEDLTRYSPELNNYYRKVLIDNIRLAEYKILDWWVRLFKKKPKMNNFLKPEVESKQRYTYSS